MSLESKHARRAEEMEQLWMAFLGLWTCWTITMGLESFGVVGGQIMIQFGENVAKVYA